MNKTLSSRAPHRDVNPTSLATGILQRKCACGEHTIAGGECAECGKEHLSLQRATGTAGLQTRNPNGVPPIVHAVLGSPGQPLNAATRAFMEPRFGHDFSRVRVHTDAQAAASARAVHALAYTVGRNVVFSSGHYQPDTATGKHLLTHELAHVVQQHLRAPLGANREPAIPQGPPELEREASRAAALVGDNHRPSVVPATAVVLQKQEVSKGQPTVAGGGWDFSKLLPGFAVEKELAAPIHFPAIDFGVFIGKPTLSLVGSVTYGPANSVVTISHGDFSSAMGGLAKSFSVNFVKGTGGKKSDVSFTSTLPGIGKHNAMPFTYKPPLTLVWSSTFTPPPYTFERLKVEGTVRVQIEIIFEPKLPGGQYLPVPSPRPVDGTPLVALAAAMAAAMEALAKIGVVLGRAVTAPIMGLDPVLTDPNSKSWTQGNTPSV